MKTSYPLSCVTREGFSVTAVVIGEKGKPIVWCVIAKRDYGWIGDTGNSSPVWYCVVQFCCDREINMYIYIHSRIHSRTKKSF